MPTKYNIQKPLLSNYGQGLMNDPAGFIAHKVAPVVPVKLESSSYIKFGKEFLKDSTRNGARAPGGRSESIRYESSNDAYSCQEHSFETFIDDEERKNNTIPMSLDESATDLITQKILITREKLVAAALFNATTFSGKTTALSGATQWSHASSTPITEIGTRGDTIRSATGIDPRNLSLIISYPVWKSLRNHATITARFQYIKPEILTPEQVAGVLGIKEILIGSGVKANDAGTMTDLWGKHALLAFIDPSAKNMKSPSVAKTFQSSDLVMDGYRDEPAHSDVIRGMVKEDYKVVFTDAGYLLTDAVA